MSGHTPGPWTLELYNRELNVQYQPARVVGADGTRLVQFDSARHDADARLIAEAPAMLEALQHLIAWDRYTGGWEGHGWEQARAILARIDGAV